MGYSSLMSKLEGNIFKLFSPDGKYFLIYRKGLDYVKKDYDFFCPQDMVTVAVVVQNTVLFISPFGISELDCATTKTDTAERSISIGRESLQVFFCNRGLGVLPGSTATG